MSRCKHKSSGDVAGTTKKSALLALEAQDPNVERYTKVAAALQNAIQCSCVAYDEKKRATTQTSLDRFFKTVDRIESSKEPEPVPSMSAVCEIAACPRLLLLTILQLYRLPPPLPPPVSNSSCLFTRCQPLCASCCTALLYFSRYCTVRLKRFYFLCLFFIYYLCEKCYKPITVQYYIADCVSWVPRLTLSDSQTKWT